MLSKKCHWITGLQQEFATFVCAISNTDAAWYSVVHLNSDIPSLPSLLKTSEANCLLIVEYLGFSVCLLTRKMMPGKYCCHNRIILLLTTASVIVCYLSRFFWLLISCCMQLCLVRKVVLGGGALTAMEKADEIVDEL